MAAIIQASINLNAIPKDKIIDGAKGKYLPITINLSNEVDNFGNQGPITVSQSKEERETKQSKVYLGNVKIVWTDGQMPEVAQRDNQQKPQRKNSAVVESDLPF